MMRVSVIIPTFNRAYCLQRAIQSVLDQTKPPDEIIVIDDGSTDNTKGLITQLFSNHSQIVYHWQPNQGVSAARNAGIQLATGDWYALLDSDDAWQPTKLEQQIRALQNTADFVICHTDEVWMRHGIRVNPMKKHKKFGGWIFELCLPMCRISPSSVLIHQQVFAEVGLFDESLPACEDYDLWLRITAKYPVLYLPQTLTIKYGGHEDQLSRKYWGMDRFRIQALQKILEHGALSKQNYIAALAMLQKKIYIYLLGARRRNKTGEILYYENLLQQYNEISKAQHCDSVTL